MVDAIRVLICDDHPMFRDGVRAAISEFQDIEVAGEASDGAEAIERAQDLAPDVILMDVKMSPSGIEATSQIKAILPRSEVVMLTASEEDEDLYSSIRAGAAGYLLKGSSIEEIAEAIRGASEGRAPISPSMASRLITEFQTLTQRQAKRADPGMPLTARELEVLQLVAKGASNKAIGEQLGISENTAKKHMRNILEKLHLKSRVEAALHAVKEGLVDE